MRETVRYITSRLTPVYGPEQAREMAFWMLEELTGLSRFEIATATSEQALPELDSAIERLLRREPIQYIFGHTTWCGLDLKVSRDTLIPRPETAELIETLPSSQEPLRVLDIGTGTGCIALAVKQKHPHWDVSAVDISEGALAVAAANSQHNRLPIHLAQVDILSNASVHHFLSTIPPFRHSVSTPFDIVISNPPYICEREKSEMEANVLDFEPHTALFVPDGDPLLFYRRIADLRLGRTLVFEINEHFGPQMVEMLVSSGYCDVTIRKDSYGKDRIVLAHTL